MESSSTEEEDEFFDALDTTPKSEAFEHSEFETLLPEEIARELEEISKSYDEKRLERVRKLEILRQKHLFKNDEMREEEEEEEKEEKEMQNQNKPKINLQPSNVKMSSGSFVQGIIEDDVLSCHPLTIIEHETQSIGSDSRSICSEQKENYEDIYNVEFSSGIPDVVKDSTHLSSRSNSESKLSTTLIHKEILNYPFRPVRRKKEISDESFQTPVSKEFTQYLTSTPTSSPIDSLSQDSKLDLQSATKGQYVVKPQDEETNKGSSERQTQESPERTLKVSKISGTRVMGHHSLGSKEGPGKIKSKGSGTGSMDSSSSFTTKDAFQLNQLLKMTTDSGKRLSDTDILKQVKVKNLDTGEEMDLMEAEEQLPQSMNPLSLHIMRLTSEYTVGDSSFQMDSDTESMMSSISSACGGIHGGKKKKRSMKNLLNTAVKKTTGAAKSLAEEASKRAHRSSKQKENKGGLHYASYDVDELKRIQGHKSGPSDFENITLAQDILAQHIGPIWCMRFSICGQMIATAGQDKILRIWVLKDSYDFFKEMRTRYSSTKTSPTNSYDNVIGDETAIKAPNDHASIFYERPFCTYEGHTSDLLDVSWSKNYFLLTSSMDKTVRLWHISRRECLCIFQHIDFVTALAFHPRNDQYFLSGSLDGKLRLWDIPDKKVTLWNEVCGNGKLITAANFIQNGKFAVVGTYDGRCIFYSTDQLKYHTTINVRSARGKNSHGRKVTGIEPMPGEDKILVTSNDSRIRLYDLRDLSLSCKFKGYTNNSSQIRATFSHDGKYITCGSENQFFYLWKTHYDSNNLTARKDRNGFYEAIKAHNSVVTCSVFASKPERILEKLFSERSEESVSSNVTKSVKASSVSGYVLVTGDYDGDIKVFYTYSKAKHSSLPSS